MFLQAPSYLWGHELLSYHRVQPCKLEQPKFTELAQCLLPTGFSKTILAILFVTYCGVQLGKEPEQTL